MSSKIITRKINLWILKYKNKRGVARIFGNILYSQILEELSDLEQFENFKDPILIPIPLSRKRLKKRGYNQVLLIAKHLADLDKDVNFKLANNVLIKIKETPHQTQIENKRKRLENLTGSFAVKNHELVRGRNIILIDDVTTTGATFKEAKKVLKSAGARKIIIFTLAH